MNALDAINQINNLRSILGVSSSFWRENLDSTTKGQVDSLLFSHWMTPAHSNVLATDQYMTYDGRSFSDYETLNLSQENVVSILDPVTTLLQTVEGNPSAEISIFNAGSLDDHPEWEVIFQLATVITTEDAQILLWPAPMSESITLDSQVPVPGWVAGVSENFTATRILRADGTWMLRDVDFRSAAGLLLFYEDPQELWTTPTTQMCGFFENHQPNRFSINTSERSGEWLAYYYRNGQSLTSFTRALAEASGLRVWNQDSYIVEAQALPVGAVYWTEYEKVVAPYPHTVLEEGLPIYRGDIIVDDGDMTVAYNADTLDIFLNETLFSDIYWQQANNFIDEHRPLGLSASVIQGS